jgi:hypothetical protein
VRYYHQALNVAKSGGYLNRTAKRDCSAYFTAEAGANRSVEHYFLLYN